MGRYYDEHEFTGYFDSFGFFDEDSNLHVIEMNGERVLDNFVDIMSEPIISTDKVHYE